MSRLRLLLAWLVMAALPLQGFAAASMLFCGVAQTAQAAVVGHGAHGHDHASQGAGDAHGHAMHAHASQDDGHIDAGGGHAATAGQDKHGHACPVCASCCQVAAASGFTPLPPADTAPGAEPPQLQVRLATRTDVPPDKPPRA